MAELVQLVRVIHACAEKRWVKQQIRLFGAGKVIGRDDLEVDEACRMIDELPSEFVPIGECDNRGPDGRCRGHMRPERNDG